MPTSTYDFLTSTTLNSAAASITISSLNTVAAGYRDLVLVINVFAQSSDVYPRIRYNGVTSTVYAWTNAYGVGSSNYGSNYGNETGQQLSNNQLASGGSGVGLPIIAQLMDFAATDKRKHILTRLGVATSGVEMLTGCAGISNAITSIQLYSSNGANLDTGTSIFLYGIKA